MDSVVVIIGMWTDQKQPKAPLKDENAGENRTLLVRKSGVHINVILAWAHSVWGMNMDGTFNKSKFYIARGKETGEIKSRSSESKTYWNANSEEEIKSIVGIEINQDSWNIGIANPPPCNECYIFYENNVLQSQ